MRIWDLNSGYLNRQSLLGEHRELHGIVSIFLNNKKGYARHPETLRWVGYVWALKIRHQQLAAEMSLRGYQEKSPVDLSGSRDIWPEIYIDDPSQQLKILGEKYQTKEPGRIPLPANAQEIWRQHKYSIMARDVNLYRKLGRDVSDMRPRQDFAELTRLLTEKLRERPSAGGIRNALQHMWGYVSDIASASKKNVDTWPLDRLLLEIQGHAMDNRAPYLLDSTALSELMVWIVEDQHGFFQPVSM